MRKRFHILVFISFCFFGHLTIHGCICPSRTLRATFKDSKAVFIGKLADDNLSSKTKIQGAKNGTLFEVEKSWKGTDDKYFSVTNEFEDMGMCSIRLKKLEKGKKYLVFAESENYEIRNYCTYTEEIYSTGD